MVNNSRMVEERAEFQSLLQEVKFKLIVDCGGKDREVAVQREQEIVIYYILTSVSLHLNNRPLTTTEERMVLVKNAVPPGTPKSLNGTCYESCCQEFIFPKSSRGER